MQHSKFTWQVRHVIKRLCKKLRRLLTVCQYTKLPLQYKQARRKVFIMVFTANATIKKVTSDFFNLTTSSNSKVF